MNCFEMLSLFGGFLACLFIFHQNDRDNRIDFSSSGSFVKIGVLLSFTLGYPGQGYYQSISSCLYRLAYPLGVDIGSPLQPPR